MSVTARCPPGLVVLLAIAAGGPACPTPLPGEPDAGASRGGEVGDACDNAFDCLSLLCSGSRVCLPNDCETDDDCDAELVCVQGCGRTCEAPATRGELCFSDSDVRRCQPFAQGCADGLTCGVVVLGFGANGQCVPPNDRALDEPCAEARECAPGLSCDADRQRCKVEHGGPCSVSDDCASESCDAGACVP